MKKLLALLCVIAMLGALCVPAMAAADRVPVVAQVPEDWATPHLYVWGASEEMAWPGVPMTLIDDWYVAYMNNDNYNIIINDGGSSQTADLSVEPSMPVCVMFLDASKQPDIGYDLPIEVPAEDKMPKPAMDTITAKVPDDWTTAYLYAWANGGAQTNGAWPGVAMTKGEDGLWVGELKSGFTNIIVTCSDAGPQTVDLTYGGGDAWVALKGDVGGKLDAAVTYTEPTDWNNVVNEAPPAPVSSVWYVAGTMNGWNCADSAYEMLPNGDGTFTYTMSLSAGDHQLKVTNGTWDVCFGDPNGPEGNYGFNLSADADVTVNYDGNGVVTVTGDGIGDFSGAEQGGAATTVTGPLYIAGTMNEWNCADSAYMMNDNGDGTFTYTFAVTPGDYALKITNGSWDWSVGGDGADGNYEFNVTDDTKCNVHFDGTAISITFGEETPEPSPEPAPEPAPEPDEPTGGNTIMIISIVATAVILIGGVVAVVLVLKKKD